MNLLAINPENGNILACFAEALIWDLQGLELGTTSRGECHLYKVKNTRPTSLSDGRSPNLH